MLPNKSIFADSVSIGGSRAPASLGQASTRDDSSKIQLAAPVFPDSVADGTRLNPSKQVARLIASDVRPTSMGRPIVVVLGMHRSGTSLLSQALHLLGVDMADETDHASHKNPDGFWERPTLNQLQDEILDLIGRPIGAASHAALFPEACWEDAAVQNCKRRLKDYLCSELTNAPGAWGFKDPRTCRLLPLWREVFDELGLSPFYVVAVRSPGEAAASMAAKNTRRAISVLQGELMWLAYNYDIVRFVVSQPHKFVEYSSWFSQGALVAQELANLISLPKVYSQAELQNCFEYLINTDHRHYREDVNATSQLQISREFYNMLSNLARDQTLSASMIDNQLAAVTAMFNCIFPFLEPLARLSVLEQTELDLKKQIGRLKHQLKEVGQTTSNFNNTLSYQMSASET